MWKKSIVSAVCFAVFATACTSSTNTASVPAQVANDSLSGLTVLANSKDRLDIYQSVPLTADLSSLSANQKKMLGLLIDASKIMDDLFWQQAYGDNKEQFLSRIADESGRRFADINYGPWDRLNGDKAFLTQTEEKPVGAQFYPEDMSKAEFEKSEFVFSGRFCFVCH